MDLEYGQDCRYVAAIRLSVNEAPELPVRRSNTSALNAALYHAARLKAAAIVIGELNGGPAELRINVVQSLSLSASTGVTSDSSHDGGNWEEDAILHWLAQNLGQLNHPLIISFGGATFDLPFLQFRSIARGIPIPPLALQINNRMKYFDKHDSGWHVDLRNLLSGWTAFPGLEFSVIVRALAKDDVSLALFSAPSLSSECKVLFYLFAKVLHARSLLEKVSVSRIADHLLVVEDVQAFVGAGNSATGDC